MVYLPMRGDLKNSLELTENMKRVIKENDQKEVNTKKF